MQEAYKKFLNEQLGSELSEPWLEAINSTPEVSVRINSHKIHLFDPELIKSKVPFCEQGFMLKSRPWFAGDPLFHAGAYYVQDSSSMVIGEMVRQLKKKLTEPVCVLDLCASPGGKSTHIASVLENSDWLVANEVIGSRVNTLTENLCKWGFPNFTVTSADAKLLGKQTQLFDIIVADMPCSGEGMFRKNNKAVEEWSESNVSLCALRQKRIAHDIWPSLKNGGYFIYSTCTFNRYENEDNVHYLCSQLGAEIIDPECKLIKGFEKTGTGMFRLFPPDVEGEGLFFCILRKTGESPVEKTNITDKKPRKNDVQITSSDLLNTCDILSYNGQFYGFHKAASNMIEKMLQLPAIKALAYPCGKDIRGELKPYGYLPLMQHFNLGILPCIEVGNEMAINYLCRDVLALNNAGQGLSTIRYHGVSLGLIQKAGHRINNMWPIDWRLRNKKHPGNISPT